MEFFIPGLKLFTWTGFPGPLSVTVSETAVQRSSIKKVSLKIYQIPQENTCVRVSLLIRLQASSLFKIQAC